MQAQAIVPRTRGDGRRAIVLLICGALLLVIGIVGLFSLQGKAVRFDAAYDAHDDLSPFYFGQLEEGQSYSLRYLPPEVERGSSVQLYLLQDGRWIPAETEKAGSYLSLPCSERSVSFAAVELQQSHTALYVGGGVAAAAALGLVLALLGRRRKKASAARTETAE